MNSLAAVCLATALYFDGRGEPLKAQEAIVEVVLNRGPDVCRTVEATGQFQEYWNPNDRFDQLGQERVVEVVDRAMKGRRTKWTRGAKFFSRALPPWAKNPVKIGGHWFYQEKFYAR